MSDSILKSAASISPGMALSRSLKVGGLVPFTAIDYPGKLAAVVFVKGCPWRCRYCHNPHLQSSDDHNIVEWSDVMALLRRRVGLIDAVVFSGGEPTLDSALPAAMREVRQLGVGVGLHTACIYPDRLAAVLPLTDWVGFDVKAPFDDYERITGVRDSGNRARACVDLILQSNVLHECRTTIHPDFFDESEILALATALANKGVRNYALQLVRTQGGRFMNPTGAATYPGDDVVRRVSAMFPNFALRRPESS